ncbi:hypothetical protein KFV02_03480 [Desulfohalobiaceae bacterium Ax17]|uniref:hypothetical protein n=1 Tax=Desulfovulcanus ferrireducens TaxID=2831190 RepID=UPI00207BBDD3|nr:hypothetical protein [Desulfovulcanus ferrireducens]MBT8762987.1 hypothetical protein [Desulfovulcanus ferrireducens]
MNPSFIFNRRPTQTNADILVRQTLPNKNLTALQAVVKLSNNLFPGVRPHIQQPSCLVSGYGRSRIFP